MNDEQAQHLKPGEFKRFWGVKLETFKQMVEIVQQQGQGKKKTRRPGKIHLEDQALMTLEYWREDRTYFHIGQSWGVTESTACRILRKIERVLSEARVFTLPGKKSLSQSDALMNAVVIDVTESPIERPKKNKSNSLVARIKRIPLSLKL